MTFLFCECQEKYIQSNLEGSVIRLYQFDVLLQNLIFLTWSIQIPCGGKLVAQEAVWMNCISDVFHERNTHNRKLRAREELSNQWYQCNTEQTTHCAEGFAQENWQSAAFIPRHLRLEILDLGPSCWCSSTMRVIFKMIWFQLPFTCNENPEIQWFRRIEYQMHHDIKKFLMN